MATSGFIWVGNHPGLDLCNTTPVVDGRPVDLLDGPEALEAWCRGVGVPSPAARRDDVAWARDVRDALRALLDPAGRGDAAGTAAARDLLDRRLAEVDAHLALADGGAVTLRAGRPAEQVRVEVATRALPAIGLDPARVRRCAHPDCVLLFHDVSKSGRRRWCDMATCGNRAKAATHYRRTRGA